MKKDIDNVLLLIPAFNEEARIAEVIKNCKKYFNNQIIIEDGSTDSTSDEVINASPSIILKHSINCGQGTALATGIKYFIEHTNYHYLVTFDGDGQHIPKDAIAMYRYANSNDYDAVFGSRFLKKDSLLQVPKHKRLVLSLAKLFEKIFYGITLSDAHNGLRVLSRKACLNLMSLNSSSMANGTEIAFRLLEANIKIEEFPCTILYDKNNKISQSPLSSLNIISDLFQKK